MNYKLCEKLKKAGFPPTEDGWVKKKGKRNWAIYNACELDGWTFTGDKEDRDTPAPTLEKLIEACGCWVDINYRCGIGSQARALNHHLGYKKMVEGKTPRNAVAKLWLKLNPLKEK